jgi:hypothetical protein
MDLPYVPYRDFIEFLGNPKEKHLIIKTEALVAV